MNTACGNDFSKQTGRDELNKVSERVIGCAYQVSNTLGNGFLEKVYENALAHDLRKVGLAVEQQSPIQVFYDGVVVGDYVADLLVEKSVLVELKAVKALDQIHFAQCLNYLKATGLNLCLLINFGTPRVQVKRIVAGKIFQETGTTDAHG
ncbi:MAG: GxxExxY protein [Pseudomonadota bacterium]